VRQLTIHRRVKPGGGEEKRAPSGDSSYLSKRRVGKGAPLRAVPTRLN